MTLTKDLKNVRSAVGTKGLPGTYQVSTKNSYS